MVPQQVLRRFVVVIGFLAATKASADPAYRAGEPVVIIDLGSEDAATRSAQRATLNQALVADPRIWVDREVAPTPPWQAHLARASKALGALDCKTARHEADRAVLALSSDHARGRQVRDPLTRAYAIVLRCGGDRDAEWVVARLRLLGHEQAPEGVDTELWNRVPTVDAEVGTAVVALTLTSKPEAAQLFLDYQPLGPAPQTTAVTPGPHIVSAISDERQRTLELEARGQTQSVELTLQVDKDQSSPAREAESTWRSRREPPSAGEVGRLLSVEGKRVALMIMPGGHVHIWALPAGTRFARRVSAAPLSDPDYVARLVDEWVRAQAGETQDLTPLLRESPEDESKKKYGSQWWVYATVGAAVTVAAIIVVADQFAADQQRIELTLP